jgi:hypothetical protein
VIHGGRIIGAKIRAEGARKRAAEAIREADRAEAEARWSIQMEAYGGPAQPSVALTVATAAIEHRTGVVTIYRKINKPPLGPLVG